MSDNFVKYQLLNSSGYKVNITKIGENVYDPIAYFHKDNFPDLHITRPGTDTDLSLLDKRALLTVNGFIYPTLFSDNKLYIPNATSSMIKSKGNSIGMLSFNKLAVELKKHVIEPSMISEEPLSTLYEKVILTFPTEIKHPILVMCGYPVFENSEFFYRVSGNSFALRLDKLNYVERLYELSKYRNIFEELGIPTSINNPNLVDANVVRSPEVITKFLTSYNSFLVELDCESINLTKIYLEHSNVPGSLRTEVEPNYPIIAGHGKFTEYIKRKNNDTKTNVYISDPYYNNFLFSKMQTSDINLYNNNRVVGSTYNLSQAFFLKIEIN